MNNKKRIFTLALAAALSLSLLSGCEGDDSSAPSGSGSTSGASGVEEAPAPGAETSQGIGRRYADLTGLYLKECGFVAPSIPDAIVKSGNDQNLGPHLQQRYTLTFATTLTVYTDLSDQHLLRVTLDRDNAPSENDSRVFQCAAGFIPVFFDSAESGAIQEQLHLTSPKKDVVYTAESTSGHYTHTTNTKGTVFDYFAQ